MKVLIAYPPLCNQKGCPTIGQNRQFQYFKSPTYIYPVVPAIAATMLKQAGHEVHWCDCLARGWDEAKFFEYLARERFDLAAFETKTPVVKQHWQFIDRLKGRLGADAPRTVLFGDHVTALPQESFEHSCVDFVLTGGDYDFLLRNLCGAVRSPGFQLRVQDLEPGIWYREKGEAKSTGQFKLDHDLSSAPWIDRDLTDWRQYAFHNGNFKRVPGTYVMSGRDCWWGKCTFCSWPTLYPRYRVRAVLDVLDEIGTLTSKLGVREIMDDTGCFPVGEWLHDFCNGVISRGYHQRAYFDCNMRFGALTADEFALMKKANFRLLLFGLESVNQATLDRVNKHLEAARIIEDCRAATQAGLFPHITMMFGYPWESFEDAQRTLRLGRWLLRKGYAYTMQATVVIPYPGSPLFNECRSQGLLRTTDWDDYDMKQPVMKTAIPDEQMRRLVQGMYGVSFSPEFMLRKVFSVRDVDDLKYYWRAARKVTGHLMDFKRV